ncbi:hypothetical protein [Amycolatopsis sp. YIM 10]|uniref:hypothetical protein n=1 Tax=Amycolatopsis sp. YIM 10 TaxID=2653857 RepID=UPI001290720A|nr:hypothetical protein [Amycolatopsis sp. YIM 10]QFU94289.1 hypothetical protein YIM_45810 [Amycolatopsis sp. YIM 10]
MTENDPAEIRRLLATTGAGEGPPMGLRADEIAARGTRIRRLRKRIAIAASAGTTVGVAVLVVFFTGGAATPMPPAPPAPVMPAVPGLTIEPPASSKPETPEQSGVPEPSESSVKIPPPASAGPPSKPPTSSAPAAMPSSELPQAPSSQPGTPAPPSTKAPG